MLENSSSQPKQYFCQTCGARYAEVLKECLYCHGHLESVLHEYAAPSDVTYPHGHKHFYELLKEAAQLHNDKNHSYAHGGSPLGNFERVSAIMKLYPKMDWAQPEIVAEIYALKQLDAYLWLKSNGHEDKFEGRKGRLMDRVVYGLIQMCIEYDKTQHPTT